MGRRLDEFLNGFLRGLEDNKRSPQITAYARPRQQQKKSQANTKEAPFHWHIPNTVGVREKYKIGKVFWLLF